MALLITVAAMFRAGNYTTSWDVTLALTAQMALAGNAHFVGAPTISSSGTTATASGKVAGLGNIDQISVIVTAEADCVNLGNHHPKAANKQTVKGGGNFPVQNGKADFSVALTATCQPECAPPMSVVWKLIEVDVYTGARTTSKLMGSASAAPWS